MNKSIIKSLYELEKLEHIFGKNNELNKARDSLQEKDLTIIPRVELVVNTKCNRRCKHCSHLMPYYDKTYELKQSCMIEVINKICRNIDFCLILGLTGGEPLLYDSLPELIQSMTKIPNIMYVDVTTNGTLLPSNELLKSLKNEKVFVNLSNYQDNDVNMKRLISLFEIEAVKFVINESKWVNFGDFKFRNKKISQLYYEYTICYDASYCKTILNGVLYHCPRAAFLSDLNIIKSPNFENISILDIEDYELKEKIHDLYNKDYISTCNYCDRVSHSDTLIEAGL